MGTDRRHRKLGLKFTNFSLQNLFGKNGYKRIGFIPQGDGQTLSLQGQTNGTYYQSYALSFIDPWFWSEKLVNLSPNFPMTPVCPHPAESSIWSPPLVTRG